MVGNFTRSISEKVGRHADWGGTKDCSCSSGFKIYWWAYKVVPIKWPLIFGTTFGSTSAIEIEFINYTVAGSSIMGRGSIPAFLVSL